MTGTDTRKFLPLMRVVKASIMDTYEDIGKVQESFLHWAARSFKELNRQSLKLGKRYAMLTVNKNTHTATLPIDFGEELFVGVLGANNMKLPLTSNDSIANVNNIEEENIIERCKVCSSPKGICEDLQVTYETNLIVINSTTYEQTITKKLYPNGDYYLETTTPYFDEVTSTIVYNTTKEFIDHLSLKSCGCIEDTEANMTALKRCAFDAYCYYYTSCDCSCSMNIGSYRIFEENGLMQLSYDFPFDKVYMEYRGAMPKIKGQLAVPEVSFETLVELTIFKSIKGRKNISNPDKKFQWDLYLNARRNMDKELGRVSLAFIIQAATEVPKFNVSYQSDWCGFFDWGEQTRKALTASSNGGNGGAGTGSGTGGNTGGGTTIITNNNYIPSDIPPSVIVNGISFNSEGSFQMADKYKHYDFLLYWNGLRYLTRNEYIVDPINAIVTVTLEDKPFTADDNYIIIPNGKI